MSGAGQSPLLVVDKVRRTFGGVVALAGVDFEVPAGELVGLIGPNGSGKSTLVNVVTRMIDAEAGTVTLEGADITNIKPHHVADVGLARTYQRLRLISELTIGENVATGLLFRHQRSFGSLTRLWLDTGALRTDVFNAADAAMDLMKVPAATRSKLPREVPFSMQRRAEIARALIAAPKVVMLDEPAAGMNPAEVAELADLLSSANKELGVAIVLIEHNMDFVMRVVRKVTVINRGLRIASGTPSEIRSNPSVIEAYLGSRSAKTNAVGA